MEQKIVARKCLHTFREMLLISSSRTKGHPDLLDTLRINDRDLMTFIIPGGKDLTLLPDWVGKSVKNNLL